MKASIFLALLPIGIGASACSVRFLAADQLKVTTNQCSTNLDCGSGAMCSGGACFATSGGIEDVLFEVVPDGMTSGSVSFLAAQSNVGTGNRHLNVTLAPASFNATINVDASSFPSDCTTLPKMQVSIQGAIEFALAGSIGSFPTYGLASAPVTVTAAPHDGDSGPFARTLLAPGEYDIYVQPKSPGTCDLPPLLMRGVNVSSDPDSSAPPVTFKLATPSALRGSVTRNGPDLGGTLAGWQVDLIEPQNGRVISTSFSWAKDADNSHVSNFAISYQPVVVAGVSSSSTGDSANNSPIVRVRPPDSMAASAPTVYWALSAIDFDGDGIVKVDMSALPTANDLVQVSGHVLGGGDGVPATVQFVSTSLDGTMGLTASFSQSATTDSNGVYTTALFPGDYKVVAASLTGGVANTQSPWAVTSIDASIGSGPARSLDVTLLAKRVIRGTAWVATGSMPALGSIAQATPTVLPDRVGVWRGALAQTPIVPNGANVAVSQVDGSFALALDPGMFDISVQSADGSNFAWWVWPRAQIAPPSSASDFLPVFPNLAFPVPIEGTLSDGQHPLANALIHAYAKVPGGSTVTRVGDTRTDSSGHYLLLLPPGFGP